MAAAQEPLAGEESGDEEGDEGRVPGRGPGGAGLLGGWGMLDEAGLEQGGEGPRLDGLAGGGLGEGLEKRRIR